MSADFAFSAVDDKDYTDMIHTICSRITFRQVVVTSVGGYRQVPAERFAKLFTEAGASSVEVVEDVEKAFGRALEVKGMTECSSAWVPCILSVRLKM